MSSWCTANSKVAFPEHCARFLCCSYSVGDGNRLGPAAADYGCIAAVYYELEFACESLFDGHGSLRGHAHDVAPPHVDLQLHIVNIDGDPHRVWVRPADVSEALAYIRG